MRETKHELPIHSFYDITGMEQHIREQAAKGWLLERMTACGWTYRRSEPKELKVHVTYCTGASQTEKPQTQLALESGSADAGWKTLAAGANLLVLATENTAADALHTNMMGEIDVMEEAAKFTSLAWLLMVVVTGSNALLFFTRLLRDTIGLLADAMSIVSGVSMTLLCCYFLTEMFTWARWKKKARAWAVHGHTDMLPTHGHHRFLMAVAAVFALGMVYVLIADRQPGLRFMLLALLAACGAIACVVSGVSALGKAKKTGRSAAGTAAVSFLIAALLVGGTGWYFVSADLRHVRSDLEMALTVEALTGKTYDDDVRKVTPRSSLFLTDVRCVQTPDVEEGEERPAGRSLSYRVVDVHLPVLTTRCWSQLLHQYDDMDRSKDADRDAPAYVFHELDAPAFGADMVYQRWAYDEPQQHYLLCWKGRFVELQADWTLTDAQMTTVGEVLAP